MGAEDSLMILGDFNLCGINWQPDSCGTYFPDPSNSCLAPASRNLLDAYSTAGLKQLCSVANENSRIIDLCFISEEMSWTTFCSLAPSPLVKNCRHHPPLLITVECEPQFNYTDMTEEVFYEFSKANFDGMNDFLLHVDWRGILHDKDASNAASTLSNILLYAVDQYVPLRTRQEPSKPAWSNKRLKQLKRRKRAALRKHSKYRTEATRLAYAEANEQYSRFNKHRYLAHQVEIQSRLKTNPKNFWRFVNDQRNQSGLPSSMTNGTLEANSTEQIASLFRSQFNSVFTNEILSTQEINITTLNVPQLPNPSLLVRVSTDMVIDALKRLKASTGYGPDCIPSVILKRCADSLADPLAAVFNVSITTGEFPMCWKDSYIFPVHKKGCKRNVTNYRGVAALNTVSKLFELIVLDLLVQSSAHYISANQHGFMAKRSTTTNLTTFTSFIIRHMEKGHQVDAVYTDLSAAFDKMNHEVALAKFYKLGFVGNSLMWLRSYLTGRSMAVKIGGFVSRPFPVTSGVPQGSHLGPFLFLLYMNDVNFILECLTLSYADDVKLYCVVNNARDALFLENQLKIFGDWCQRNRMLLNVSKCSIISFGRKHSLIRHDYSLNNSNLERLTTVKDLGIMLDSKLSFKAHISYIVSKASSQLGFIFRFAKDFKDISCLKALYCALVRPILEYCCVVWAPFYQNEIQRIEKIQSKFIRYALRFLNWRNPLNLPSYESRCLLIRLEQLCARRKVAKACFIADLLQSYIDSSTLLDNIGINIRPRTLRSHSFLNIRHSRTNYGYNEPMRNMCLVFNECYNVFEFNVSRLVNKNSFKRILC